MLAAACGGLPPSIMLSRYTMIRGARPTASPLPRGIRQDTRKHTRHVLRPTAELVAGFLGDGSEASFRRFRAAYRQLLEERYRQERPRFDQLAQLAASQDVFLGCSCPTARQPHVARCHTTLALEFMSERYPGLRVK